MRLFIICATMLLASASAEARGIVLLGEVNLDNRFVEIRRDGEPVKLKNKTMIVSIESDQSDFSESFTITTTIEHKNKSYNTSGDCSWIDEDTKRKAKCSIDSDGGHYIAIVDWNENQDLSKLFLRFDKDGFRIAETEETKNDIGSEYTLGANKKTLTLPVELEEQFEQGDKEEETEKEAPEEELPVDESEESEG